MTLKIKQRKAEILPKDFEVRDLVGLSWETLQGIFKQMEGRSLTKEELPNWKLLLGFVNSTNNSVKTSMQCYRLIELSLAVPKVKEAMNIKHRKRK
jgi:hypothetical protein